MILVDTALKAREMEGRRIRVGLIELWLHLTRARQPHREYNTWDEAGRRL